MAERTTACMCCSDRLGQVVQLHKADIEGAIDLIGTPGPPDDDDRPAVLFGAIEDVFALTKTAIEYDSNSVIFFSIVDGLCYFQYGLDEDDAITRLVRALELNISEE